MMHIGLFGLHFPLTHLAVLFSAKFETKPIPQANLTIVPDPNVAFGSFPKKIIKWLVCCKIYKILILPCLTNSILTKGSFCKGSQGPPLVLL